MASAKFKVIGMSCGHCRQKVEHALKQVAGVYTAVVDLHDGNAEVDFNDDVVTVQQLVVSVAQAGYEARLIG